MQKTNLNLSLRASFPLRRPLGQVCEAVSITVREIASAMKLPRTSARKGKDNDSGSYIFTDPKTRQVFLLTEASQRSRARRSFNPQINRAIFSTICIGKNLIPVFLRLV